MPVFGRARHALQIRGVAEGLEVAAADEQVHGPARLRVGLQNRVVDLGQLAVAAALHRNLRPGALFAARPRLGAPNPNHAPAAAFAAAAAALHL